MKITIEGEVGDGQNILASEIAAILERKPFIGPVAILLNHKVWRNGTKYVDGKPAKHEVIVKTRKVVRR